MATIHTPAKKPASEERDRSSIGSTNETEKARPSLKRSPTPTTSVRRSVGEWETGRVEPKTVSETSPKINQKTRPVPKSKTIVPLEGMELQKVPAGLSGVPKKASLQYRNRVAEARACLNKAKLHLGNSKNLKTEIKNEVVQAIDRLYQLVKEAELEKEKTSGKIAGTVRQEIEETQAKGGEIKAFYYEEGKDSEDTFLKKLDEHAKLLEENKKEMESLKAILCQQECRERTTYASVTASTVRKTPPETTAIHSVAVTSKLETETGEECIYKLLCNEKDKAILIKVAIKDIVQ
ncbi:unnamed protein product [Arctia plantaginis]|uniref:Uncharacterized protein n=1 Tax=Arctia plantaginis TaxID=874455 RepID=A0A8S1BP74_ARCPL|nr:unnamed protein product [Arctia plantaginis]